MSEIILGSSNSGVNSVSRILKAVKFIFISYVVSVILLAVLAALIVYTDMPESFAAPLVKAITLFGALLSSFLTARNVHARGWLCGLFTGALSIVVLVIIGMFIVNSKIFTLSNFWLVSGGALCGTVGGIAGVNSGNN